jgi:hypothetical protein
MKQFILNMEKQSNAILNRDRLRDLEIYTKEVYSAVAGNAFNCRHQ